MTGPPKRRDPLPAGAGGARPLVALVGRPNVGKSTLFNRLAGRHVAIVEDVPGVTRDRHYADTEARGHEYVLVDTGGFDPESEDPMKHSIAEQVRLAIDEAELVVCVLDASTEATPADREAVQLLREAAKPTIYVANKADSPRRSAEALSLYELGVADVLSISATHGRGIGELEDRIAVRLPPMQEPSPYEGLDAARIAIVGRPNAGKSSLVNRLLGEDRLVVNDRPGTTVDSVDALLRREGKDPRILIDTAGIRKRGRVKKVRGVEGLSVIHAIRAMQRCHAAVLLIDAHLGPGEQDAKIASLAAERGRAVVIGLNKQDLLKGNKDARTHAITRTRELLRGVSWAPVVTISAQSGRGVSKLMDAVDASLIEHNRRLPTAQLNRFFSEVLEKHPPPTAGTKAVRLFYVTQAEVRPPTFIVMTNRPDDVHWSYRGYVENQLRARFGFEGSAIRVKWRARRRRDDEA